MYHYDTIYMSSENWLICFHSFAYFCHTNSCGGARTCTVSKKAAGNTSSSLGPGSADTWVNPAFYDAVCVSSPFCSWQANYVNLMASIFNHTEQVQLHLLSFFAFHSDRKQKRQPHNSVTAKSVNPIFLFPNYAG